MAVPSDKPEFPPLLAPGMHIMTDEEIKVLCVDSFPGSLRRPTLMEGLKSALAILRRCNSLREVWIDGSFTTTKAEPDDVDLLLRFDGPLVEALKPEDEIALTAVLDKCRNAVLNCHVNLYFEFPNDHPRYWEGHYWYCYWMRQWGFSREDSLKGIIVVPVPAPEKA